MLTQIGEIFQNAPKAIEKKIVFSLKERAIAQGKFGLPSHPRYRNLQTLERGSVVFP